MSYITIEKACIHNIAFDIEEPVNNFLHERELAPFDERELDRACAKLEMAADLTEMRLEKLAEDFNNYIKTSIDERVSFDFKPGSDHMDVLIGRHVMYRYEW